MPMPQQLSPDGLAVLRMLAGLDPAGGGAAMPSGNAITNALMRRPPPGVPPDMLALAGLSPDPSVISGSAGDRTLLGGGGRDELGGRRSDFDDPIRRPIVPKPQYAVPGGVVRSLPTPPASAVQDYVEREAATRNVSPAVVWAELQAEGAPGSAGRDPSMITGRGPGMDAGVLAPPAPPVTPAPRPGGAQAAETAPALPGHFGVDLTGPAAPSPSPPLPPLAGPGPRTAPRRPVGAPAASRPSFTPGEDLPSMLPDPNDPQSGLNPNLPGITASPEESGLAEQLIDGKPAGQPKSFWERLNENPAVGRMALLMGLNLMAAGGRPGASLLGAVGQAGLGTVGQMERERRTDILEKREDRQEKRDQRRLDIDETRYERDALWRREDKGAERDMRRELAKLEDQRKRYEAEMRSEDRRIAAAATAGHREVMAEIARGNQELRRLQIGNAKTDEERAAERQKAEDDSADKLEKQLWERATDKLTGREKPVPSGFASWQDWIDAEVARKRPRSTRAEAWKSHKLQSEASRVAAEVAAGRMTREQAEAELKKLGAE